MKREIYYKFETDHGLDPFYSFRYRLYNHVSHHLFWEIKFVSIHLYALVQVAIKIAKNTGDTSLKGRFNIGIISLNQEIHYTLATCESLSLLCCVINKKIVQLCIQICFIIQFKCRI